MATIVAVSAAAFADCEPIVRVAIFWEAIGIVSAALCTRKAPT